MSHRLIFICNMCGIEYAPQDAVDLPPYWVGVQIAIANGGGQIPPQEREVFCHFCSTECLAKYAVGSEVRTRKCMVDRPPEDEAES